MLICLVCGIAIGWIFGFQRGERRGWRDGITIARHWEGFCRDWRMKFEMEIADTEHERTAIEEVRQLERMYDGF